MSNIEFVFERGIDLLYSVSREFISRAAEAGGPWEMPVPESDLTSVKEPLG